MKLNLYHFSFGTHRGKDVVWIRFSKMDALIRALRNRFPSAKWSNTNKAWYLPDLPSVRKEIRMAPKDIGDSV